MSSIVEIKAATPTVTCDEAGSAEHIVNVHNTSGRPLRVGMRVHVEEPAKAEWIGQAFDAKNEDETEWDLDADATVQLTVPIDASDAGPGTYTFRVEVYSTDAPSEDYSTSDGIAFEVKASEPDVETDDGGFPWWILILVGVLVVLGVGGGLIYYFVVTASVPNVIGLPRDQAVTQIEEASLVVGTEEREVSEDEPENTVTGQNPESGRVKKGSAVNLVIADAPDPFRVVSVDLAASQTNYRGVCPVTIQFKGRITTDGTHPGNVSYRFTRSDGAMAPVQQLTFDSAGTKTVSNTWRIGRSLRGWQQLVISSPEQKSSAKAGFQIVCLTNADLFTGNWVNVDANTRGITRTQISRSGSRLVVHMWGACSPTDCDWGTVSTSVSDADDKVLKIRWDQGFAVRTQTLTLLSNGHLRVNSFTRYTDNSGRADQRHVYEFRKR